VNHEEDIVKNIGNQTTLDTIDFICKDKQTNHFSKYLLFFFVPKKMHIHFWVNCPFTNKTMWTTPVCSHNRSCLCIES